MSRVILAGPGSSTSNWKPTFDSGKLAGASKSSTDGYRVAGDHSGPTSSHRAYTSTVDTGIFEAARGSDGYRVAGDHSGPTSSHRAYTSTVDTGIFEAARGSDGYNAI